MNLLDAIGNTPLIQLNNITRGLKSKVFAKLEFTNPGGSIKDRIAKYMIEKAELEGKLKPGDTILENSSGNTAMGLAIVAKQKGYNLKIVIRDTTSREKLEVLKCLGVEMILVDASISPEREDSYNNLARNIAKENDDLFYVDQHYNLDNNETYYKTFAPEMWEQTQGRIDYFIAGVGTGGTISGTAKFLKEKNPGIKIIGIDPIGSVFYEYFKNKKLVKPEKYLIEGLGDEFLIATAQLDLIDDMIQVTDKTAFEWTKKLAFEEGIIAGGSSGANIWGALQLARKIDKEANIITVFPGSGYKYISTVYNVEWLKENNLL